MANKEAETRSKGCVNTCVFFPQEPNEILEEYYDDYGIKHRKVIRRCGYDGHILKTWKRKCPWEKDKEKKKESENA